MARKYIGERGGRSAPKLKNPRKQSEIRYTVNEALGIFVRAKEAEGVRPRTIENYYSHITYLMTFLERSQTSFYIDELTSEMIRDYIIYLKNERIAYAGLKGRKISDKAGLSANTINMRLRTLRTMCRFWCAEGMINGNPMANVKLVKDDHEQEVPGLTDEEISRILSYYDERQFAQWRDKTLVLLLLDVGLRIQEAVSLKIGQIDVKRSEIFIPSEVAKNRKGREVPVSREIVKRMLDLYEENKQYFGENDEIFMNAYGEPYTAEAFRRRLNRMKKKIGIPKLHPHMFRHTFCRDYLLNGGDLFTLQKIVDHADIKTTRKYVQMDGEHVRKQHNKYSPSRRWLRK